MKALWIKNEKVENTSIWDENSNTPEGYEIVLVEDDFCAGIGFTRVNGEFIPPPQEETSPQE